ncbi:MAG: hypothetical protein GEU78_13735 [Actinobacteria bacterium]|nr:hypothetical protein [Actinomycetota bacterium]
MSLLLGQWDVVAAVRVAFGREATKKDSVRHAPAACLDASGFMVIHDHDPFPAHVSVQFEAEWTEEVCEMFHDCFESGATDG